MTDVTLRKLEGTDLDSITDQDLKTYERLLQEKAGLYLRAYRTITDRLRKVGQERHRRRNS